MQIKEEIVNAGHGYLNPSLFAVHSTANPGATARNHRDLWSRGYDYAVHLTSDWTEAIHCVPYDRLCWQVGNGNGTCEGIEICEATNASDFRRGTDIAADVIAQRAFVQLVQQKLSGATAGQEVDIMAGMMIRNDNTGVIYYCEPGKGRTALTHPDQANLLQQAGVPLIHGNNGAPWWGRFDQVDALVRKTMEQLGV